MLREELVRLLRSIPEYDAGREQKRHLKYTPRRIHTKETNPYSKYKNGAADTKHREVSVGVGALRLLLRVKPSSTINDVLCTALSLVISKEELSSHDKGTEQFLQDVRSGLLSDKQIEVLETEDRAVLDKQCSIKFLSRSFSLQRQDARTVMLYNADSTHTEVLRLEEGMTVGDLRKAKDLTMSYNIREGSDPDKSMPDDLLIYKDLIIEHVPRKDELTMSQDFRRAYSVTQKLFMVLSAEGVLHASASSISLVRASIFPKKETITKISLNQIVDVHITGKKIKVVYTEGSTQKTLRFAFHRKEDAIEFTKYSKLLFLSAP
ncbi:hypothetical protein NECID01_2098 [Nematocida sp. AWRm77]|nr:hypothetical protein NECID01_2098 [Nematocida sp. AWRm77]